MAGVLEVWAPAEHRAGWHKVAHAHLADIPRDFLRETERRLEGIVFDPG